MRFYGAKNKVCNPCTLYFYSWHYTLFRVLTTLLPTHPRLHRGRRSRRPRRGPPSSMEAEFWHGLYCYEKSRMEGGRTFPMSEEGRLEMKAWLEEQA